MISKAMQRKQEMVNRAIEEASIHNIDIPVSIGDHISTVATIILGAFVEYGADDLYDYWNGNFVIHGLV